MIAAAKGTAFTDAQPIGVCIERLARDLKLHRGTNFGEVSKSTYWQRTPQIALVSASSKLDARHCPLIGVAGHLPRNGGRGGARNSASRHSYGLNVAQVSNLIAAACHAEAIGLSLNRMVTVHWQSAGIPLEGMAKATRRFVDLLTKAIDRHGSATAWLSVHEGGVDKGGHLHLLVHVPPTMVPKLTGLQKRWLRAITGNAYRCRVICSRPIGGRLGLEIGNPDLHASNLDATLKYVLKGADAVAALQFGLERLEPGGLVIGKRCGTSQNIGPMARRQENLKGNVDDNSEK